MIFLRKIQIFDFKVIFGIFILLLIISFALYFFFTSNPYYHNLLISEVASQENISSKLGALSTYFYTFTAILALLAILATLFFASVQISSTKKDRHLNFLLELSNFYMTDRMYLAVKAVKDMKLSCLKNNPRDIQRRIVADFWNMVGTAVLDGGIEIELIHKRFPDGPIIWKKLRKLELISRKRIERDRYPKINKRTLKDRTIKHTNGLPANLLYEQWIKKYP
jgi:hypothetical protein